VKSAPRTVGVMAARAAAMLRMVLNCMMIALVLDCARNLGLDRAVLTVADKGL
jgi:hypothetical protein